MEVQRRSDPKNKINSFNKRGGKKPLTLDLLGHIYGFIWGIFIDFGAFSPITSREDFLSLLSSSSNNLFSKSRAERLIWESPKRKPGGSGHLRSVQEAGACVSCPFSHPFLARVVKHTLGNKICVNFQCSKHSYCQLAGVSCFGYPSAALILND